MSARASRLPREVHALARAHGWPPSETLRLSLRQRLGYLMLLEEEADRALFGDLP
jgi:hypothetical protein